MFKRAFISLLILCISSAVLAAEFSSTDINTGIAGSTTGVGVDGFDITASGADIWGTTDGLRFHYQEISGDFDIRARVSSIQNVNTWSKAGVALRESLAANSAHAMTVATPGNGFAFQYRTAEGGSSLHVSGGGTFYPFSWVRLVRIGQMVTSYKSVDPTADEWDFIGSISLSSTDPVYVGLVVTSHNNAVLCKAEFRNVDLHAYAPPVSGTGDGLSAHYFNSRNLSGAAALSRIDSKVDFNWTTGSPDAAINANNFSVRWSGQVQAQFSEEYTFYTTSDDGVRLWVNGNLIVDHWTDHSRTENRTYPIPLVAGQKYDLVMEFFENGGSAESRLMWASRSTLKEAIPQSQLYSTVIAPPTGTGSGLKGEYFAGREFGTKVLTRVDSSVDFSWGTGAPSPAVGSNDFAVRWTGLVEPKFTGQYTFYTVSDDGVRLWIDNQLIINNWTDHSSIENNGSIALSAGQKYAVRLEFYENSGDAVAKLLWSSVDQAQEVIPSSQLYPGLGTGLFAEYYDNDDLTNLKFTRVDPVIDFDWASGSPAASIEADTFSVRWTGKVEPLFSEAYTFFTLSNDGVRLWVNGQLVIDNWTDHATVEDASAPVILSAGTPVEIKMEFKESSGDAVVKLLWSSANQQKQVISSTQLLPNGGILVDIPVTSAVSPAFIEGTCWSPTQQTFSIDGNGASVTLLANTRFFSNLPLDPNLPTTISFAHSETGVAASGSILWVPTDIAGKTFSNNQLLLRKGDSLLLSVSGVGNEPIEIDANGDGITEYTGLSGDNFQYQFQTPGIFIVTGIKNGTLAGNVLVKVVDVNLEKPIACAVGFNRRKHVIVTPTQLRPEVIFDSSDSSLLDVQPLGFAVDSIDGEVAAISLRAKRRGTPVLISRLGNGTGPIVAHREVDEFTTTKETLIGGTFNAEDGLGGAELLIHPFVPNIRFEFIMFAHTATFEDGSTTLSVNTSDIDPETGDPYFETLFDPISNEIVGRYTVKMHLPEGETKYCFTSAAYQSSSDEQEVEAKANNNGDPCIARCNKLNFCKDGEQATLSIILTKRKEGGGPHEVTISGPEGSVTPRIIGNKIFNCAGTAGAAQEYNVTPEGVLPGKFDVKVGKATFKGCIEVHDVQVVLNFRNRGIWTQQEVGGIGYIKRDGVAMHCGPDLGVVPFVNEEFKNVEESSGKVCAGDRDAYKWHRDRTVRRYLYKPNERAPKTIFTSRTMTARPDEPFVPAEGNDDTSAGDIGADDGDPDLKAMIYFGDCPNLATNEDDIVEPDNDLRNAPVSSVVALRFTAVEWVTKGGVRVSNILQWHSYITIRKDGDGWVRKGINEIEEGAGKTTFDRAEATKVRDTP